MLCGPVCGACKPLSPVAQAFRDFIRQERAQIAALERRFGMSD